MKKVKVEPLKDIVSLPGDREYRAYCLKCKKENLVVHAELKVLTYPNGRRTYLIGYCEVCNSKVHNAVGIKKKEVV